MNPTTQPFFPLEATSDIVAGCHNPVPARSQSEMEERGFEVRQIDARDVQHAVEWVAGDRAFAGRHDAEALLHADPQGFLGAMLDNQLAAAGWLIVYSDDYSFLGGLAVAPQWRGRRIGLLLARALRARAGRRTVGIEIPRSRQRVFERYGFQAAHTTTRFAGVVGGETRRAVVSLERVPFFKLAEFDAIHFPAPRSSFLQAWTTQPGSVALAKMHRGQMLGYGVMRPCGEGYRIGPLFAQDAWVAEDLFQTFAARANGATIVLDIPDANPHAPQLVDENSLIPLFHTVRMHAGNPPDVPNDRIFAITAPELG